MKLYGSKDVDKAVADMRSFFAALPDMKLEIRREVKNKTGPQNALLHVVIRAIAKHHDMSEERAKEDLLKRNLWGVFPHWPQDIVKFAGTGNSQFAPIGATDMVDRDIAELLTHLHVLCVEWSIEV